MYGADGAVAVAGMCQSHHGFLRQEIGRIYVHIRQFVRDDFCSLLTSNPGDVIPGLHFSEVIFSQL